MLAAIVIAVAVPDVFWVLMFFAPGLILGGLSAWGLSRLGVPVPLIVLLVVGLVTASPVMFFWGACVFFSACL